ncbi:MAG: hypothetical protein AAGG51_07065 [Cyanobacteria bacterium P01_G01_bin.54]
MCAFTLRKDITLPGGPVDLINEWIYDDEGRLLYVIDEEKYDPNRDTSVDPTVFSTKSEYDANGSSEFGGIIVY